MFRTFTKQKKKEMPQLDALTYLAQYLYFLVTFVTVYFFVLSFIIPKTLCALKVRQKLNSIGASGEGAEARGGLRPQAGGGSLELAAHYSSLRKSNWVSETAKAGSTGAAGPWLASARALQLAQVVRLKKLLCKQAVQKIGN